jgi:hypothetical protein
MPDNHDKMVHQGEVLHRLMKEISYYEGSTIEAIVEMGKRWKQIRDEKLWKIMQHCHSFREFCEKEAKKSHSTVYNFIGIEEKFGAEVRKRLLACDTAPSIDHSRLIRLLPFAKEENASELLLSAEEHNASDFDDTITEMKGGRLKVECAHMGIMEHWERCPECGKFKKL